MDKTGKIVKSLLTLLLDKLVRVPESIFWTQILEISMESVKLSVDRLPDVIVEESMRRTMEYAMGRR